MPFSTFMTQMVINFKYTGKIIINKLPYFINRCVIENIQSFYSDLSIEDFRLLILKQSVNMLKFAEYEGEIILARNGHLLGCAFHPELTVFQEF